MEKRKLSEIARLQVVQYATCTQARHKGRLTPNWVVGLKS